MSPKIRRELASLKNFIFDCDGVLWHGNDRLPSVDRFLKLLREEKKRVFFVTNNSSKTRAQYAAKFEKLGIQADVSEIFGAGYLCAQYLARNKPKGLIYLMGSEAIAAELEEVGLDSVGTGKDGSNYDIDADVWSKTELNSDISDVVVGFDKDFSFSKLLKCSSYIQNGANFVASNEDSELPIGRNDLCVPGTGCFVAAVKFATKKDPVVVGKPSTFAFDLISQIYGAKSNETVMFGDRLDTDIIFGKNCGLTTVLTLTGVTKEEMLESSCVKPDIIIRNFGDLFE